MKQTVFILFRFLKEECVVVLLDMFTGDNVIPWHHNYLPIVSPVIGGRRSLIVSPTPGLKIDQIRDWRGTGFYVNNSPAENLFAVTNGKFSPCFCVVTSQL